MPDPVVTPPPVPAPKQTEAERAKALIDKLWADTTLGPQVRRAAKEMYPEINTPEDQLDPIIAPFKAQVEALTADLAKERADREGREIADANARAELAMRNEFEQAKSRFRLNEAGEKLTLDFM